MNVLAIIPARGGSKGIPRKNLRLLGGKPLITHTIEHALVSTMVNRTVVSTDDEDIAHTARQAAAEVIMRPALISGDEASSESALIHVLDSLKSEGYIPDMVVFLQCTSPLREAGDVDRAIGKMLSENADSLLSVVPSHRFIWIVEGGETKPINYDFRNRKRRQDMNPQYMENGSMYLFKRWVLEREGNRLGGKVALYVMHEDSAVEIDEPADFAIIERIMATKVER